MTTLTPATAPRYASHGYEPGDPVMILPWPHADTRFLVPEDLLASTTTEPQRGTVLDAHHDGIAWLIRVIAEGQTEPLPYTLAELVQIP